MSELRAPDPTLDRLHHRAYVYTTGMDDEIRTAHLPSSDCGAQLHHPERAGDAKWFAVPCRECFPDAPPPGKHPFSSDLTALNDAHLKWQVPS